MTLDFSHRSTRSEIIDDMELDRSTMAGVLRELEVINRYLGGHSTTIAAVESLLDAGPRPTMLRVLDVGAGGGDTARALVEWGRTKNIRVVVVSVDLSHGAVAFAHDALASTPDAAVVQANVLALPFADGAFDVTMCSLFLHHFVQSDAARIVAAMARASRLGAIVNDLHRHPLAYAGIWLATRVFGASAIVRNDGPLSVLRAFRRADFRELGELSGLDLDARWRWAFRWQVLIRGRSS